MQIRASLFALLLGIFVIGCSRSPKSGAVVVAREVGVSKLREDLKALAASPAGQQYEIAQSAWPDSVRRFRPMAVHPHGEGVFIVLSPAGREREQEGLLVMLDPQNDPGGGGSGVRYESLGNGLYWCLEKVRVRAPRPNE